MKKLDEEGIAYGQYIHAQYRDMLAEVGLYDIRMDPMNILIVAGAVIKDRVLFLRSMAGNKTPLSEAEKAALRRRVEATVAGGARS
jgi:hypothetical protein